MLTDLGLKTEEQIKQSQNGDKNGEDIDNNPSNTVTKIHLPSQFMFEDIMEYERTVGFPVNEAFKMGWNMARTLKIK